MHPTNALILCSDLSREADPLRVACHVCIEHDGTTATIAGTNGTSALRFAFTAAECEGLWLQDVAGRCTHPGNAFPKWGSAKWQVAAQSEALPQGAARSMSARIELTAHTKGGKRRASQPSPVDLRPTPGLLLQVWKSISNRPDNLAIDLAGSRLSAVVETLDGAAFVSLWSDGQLRLAAGSYRSGYLLADLGVKAPVFEPRDLNVAALWRALCAFEPAALEVARDDDRAPVALVASGCTSIIMPCSP